MQMDKEFFNAIVGKIAWLKHKRKKKDTKEVNQNTKPKYSKGKKCFTGKKKKRKKKPYQIKEKNIGKYGSVSSFSRHTYN